MNNYTKVITPVGKAYYPHVRSTEVFEDKDSGKYVCGIILDDKTTTKYINQLEKEWEAAKAEFVKAGKKFGRNSQPHLGYTENDKGDIIFKAKTNAVMKFKDGNTKEVTVPVFDKYGKPMDADVEIGHGSKIQLCFLVRPFYGSSNIYGLQLLLNAIMVKEFVPYGSDASSAEDFGFEVESHPDNPFDAENEEVIEDSLESADF